MDMSALTNAYSDYYSQLKDSVSGTEAAKKLSTAAQSASTDDELMDVCKQFEAYLLEQLMKNMEKTAHVFDDEENNGATDSLVDFFKDRTLQTLASDSTEREGLGIARMLYENMKVNMGLTLDDITKAEAESGAVTPDSAE